MFRGNCLNMFKFKILVLKAVVCNAMHFAVTVFISIAAALVPRISNIYMRRWVRWKFKCKCGQAYTRRCRKSVISSHYELLGKAGRECSLIAQQPLQIWSVQMYSNQTKCICQQVLEQHPTIYCFFFLATIGFGTCPNLSPFN